ncbi:MAG: hypothetical protein EBV28_06765 [Betaproteobacteria bacterium]|nr:hypothetical protein [Betaproteobacteria bacterium]
MGADVRADAGADPGVDAGVAAGVAAVADTGADAADAAGAAGVAASAPGAAAVTTTIDSGRRCKANRSGSRSDALGVGHTACWKWAGPKAQKATGTWAKASKVIRRRVMVR